MILSAAVWCGQGCLNTPTIDDITRHPFTTSPPYIGANHKSSPDPPVLAICTQLIDLCTSSRRRKSSNILENSASSCVRIGSYPDTIQITSRNHTVHIFQHCSDLQAIICEEKGAKSLSPKYGDMYLKMMRALVGFGAGKGGSWVQIGYIGSGGSSRGISPLSISRASRVERSLRLAESTNSTLTSNRRVCSSGGSGLHPISAALSLFQALSSVPDILITRPAQSAPETNGSSFSALSMSRSFTDPSDSSSGGGFGFGFGMLSSKPRSSAGISTNTVRVRNSGADVDAEKIMAAAQQALTARLNTLLTYCEGLINNVSLPPDSAATDFNDKSESEEHLSTAQIALSSIDGDGEEEEEGGTNVCGVPSSPSGVAGSSATKDMITVMKQLASFSEVLRPCALSLLTSATTEQAASISQSIAFSFPGSKHMENGDDIVLTYVLVELICCLLSWCSVEINKTMDFKDTNNAGRNMRIASVIADKFLSLSLDDSALNAILGALSERILRGIVEENNELSDKDESNEKDSNSFMDSLLSNADTEDSVPIISNADVDKNSLTPKPRIGGTCVAHCLVSSSQDVLYEVFVLSALKSKGIDDHLSSASSDTHISDMDMDAEDIGRRKIADMNSLVKLISLPSSTVESGPGFDVFSLLTTTQCSLWLVNVTPLGDLIGKLALQRFKTTKDSMDIFLEMVVAGQTDKLFMLAKADRNNTGKTIRGKERKV